MGVVYIDANGLKLMNDTRGHNEGDKMIKSVADKIKTVYKGSDIYRAGGDEFLVIVTDMDKDRFFSHFQQLKSLSEIKGEPAFAIGSCYDDTGMDIK